MRADKVVTFRRVRVKEDLHESHVAYQHRGMTGTIQPPAQHYGSMGSAVGVKLDDNPNTTYYFKPEWLDDLSKPLPEAGDTVIVEAKVVERNGEQIFVAAGSTAHGGDTNWIDRSDVKQVVKRVEKALTEPPINSVVFGKLDPPTSTVVGTWWNRRALNYERPWYNMSTGIYVSWKDVVEQVHKHKANFHVYHFSSKHVHGESF